MLRRSGELQWSQVISLDGEIGKVRDVCFDEASWMVRYLIVDTGGWLSGRKVPIDPRSVELIDRNLHTVWVSLSRAQIESSPRIDIGELGAREHEMQLNRHYGYGSCWTHSMPWGNGQVSPARRSAAEALEIDAPSACLRGARQMLDFTLITVDGHVGLIKDFFFDDETWALRYLIVQTGSWLLGRRVLVSADRVRRVDWSAESVEVNQTRKQIEYGWEFDADNPPPGDLETALRTHARTEAWRQ